jgi:hypothetical protein
MKKSKLMLGACVFSLGIAAAASSYHVKISDTTWVGTTELKPGEYTVQVEGDKVTFKMGKNAVTVPAKVEENASKFSDNQMLVKTENGQPKLKEIDLAGSKSKILFNEASPVEAGGTH